MCNHCQTAPRVIDHKTVCCNICGNLPLLQCEPDDPTSNEVCDLWVPEDHFKYHDHYVNFIVDDEFEGPWSGYEPAQWLLFKWIEYKFAHGCMTYREFCEMEKGLFIDAYKKAENA